MSTHTHTHTHTATASDATASDATVDRVEFAPRAVAASSEMVAIVDIDGVVYDFDGELAVAASSLTGRPLRDFPRAEVWAFFAEQWGFTVDEFFDLYERAVAEFGLCRTGMPLPGSVAGWQRLAGTGVKIHVVTDCGPPQNPAPARAARLEWLTEWGFTFDDVTFTGAKADVVAGYVAAGARVFAIDDRPENVESMREAGAVSFMRSQRWNASHRLTHQRLRVTDLAEFAERVSGLQVPSAATAAETVFVAPGFAA